MDRIRELISYKVGKRVNILIEKHFGGNKSRFGKLLGLDNSAVNKLINGKRYGLTFYQMYNLRTQHQIDLNDLITGEYTEGSTDQMEEDSAHYTLGAKKDIQRLQTEIDYLKKSIQDKEEVIASKDQIVDYLKIRINGLLEREY
ncbi:MAG: hypothetical protein ACPG19_14240 [Saprospiraceae bacterium]